MTAATQYRSRHDGGPDLRGNNRDRRRRREWLVDAWRADVDVILGYRLGSIEPDLIPVPLGSGAPACRCYRCGCLLTESTVTADRKIPGCKGGRYTRDNIRPACASCNSTTGGGLRADDEGRPW